MKKISIGIQYLALVLVFILALGMTACTNTRSETEREQAQPEETSVTETSQSEPEETSETELQIEESDTPDDASQSSEDSEDETSSDTADSKENSEMIMLIGDTLVTVEWEQNESVEALRQLVSENPLTIRMSMYGGFEQVGSIGQSLPRNDVQTTTSAGDIVLYSGDQIVVFYGSNSWAYTRLGHITSQSADGMAELLGNGDVTITIEGGQE